MKSGERSTAALPSLLPLLAIVGTFGLFAFDQPDEVIAVGRSARGIITVALIIAAFIGVSFALRRLPWSPWIVASIRTALVLGLAWLLIGPFYVDKTVSRRIVAGTLPVSSASPSREVAPEGSVEPDSGERPVAQVAATGPLRGIDHNASGTATLIAQPDGELVVRLEDFSFDRVPDARLHLVEGTGKERGGTDLGALAGNRGDVLDVVVPRDLPAGAGWTVLVWCRAFAVPIANASLS